MCTYRERLSFHLYVCIACGPFISLSLLIDSSHEITINNEINILAICSYTYDFSPEIYMTVEAYKEEGKSYIYIRIYNMCTHTNDGRETAFAHSFFEMYINRLQ